MKIIYLASFLVMVSYMANACVLSKNLNENFDATMDCPMDIKKFSERVAMCIHLGGEVSGNLERDALLSKSVSKIKCNSIEKDGIKLMNTPYKTSEEIEIIKLLIRRYNE